MAAKYDLVVVGSVESGKYPSWAELLEPLKPVIVEHIGLLSKYMVLNIEGKKQINGDIDQFASSQYERGDQLSFYPATNGASIHYTADRSHWIVSLALPVERERLTDASAETLLVQLWELLHSKHPVFAAAGEELGVEEFVSPILAGHASPLEIDFCDLVILSKDATGVFPEIGRSRLSKGILVRKRFLFKDVYNRS